MKASGLFVNVSGLALAVAVSSFAAPAMAQDNQNDDQVAAADATEGTAIVITGVRGCVTNAVNTKRRAEQSSNSISAQDIGALPDRSVAETLQRIPGVALTRTAIGIHDRPSHRSGAVCAGRRRRDHSWSHWRLPKRRPGYFLCRERPYARLVGYFLRPDCRRRHLQESLAEMIEGGISGIIDLRGRKPFDQSGQLISLSADLPVAIFRRRPIGRATRLQQSLGHAGTEGKSASWCRKHQQQGYPHRIRSRPAALAPIR